ncbi:MAG: HDOD domain-containing protein [Nitrospinaceae bacterium]|nr:HDOD domain-containing protein [Nitrospinaceae bacterium]MBT5869599.1 HDOD domain-containing protein [Nitrospinaceae bacterium]MBT6347332.1 HDOD domain-containing protein [Nitrospina sp.]
MKAKEDRDFRIELMELVENNPTLATLPGVYSEFREAVEDPDLVFERVEKVVLKDPQLTARLLRIVNSAFYNFSQKIETISHAVSVVGTEQLSYLVLSTGVMDKFKGIPDTVLNMESYWRHSIACGLIAKKLAVYNGELNAERFFITGLLHDIGRLVMCLQIPHRNWEFLIRSRSENKAVHLIEMNELGFDHAQLGGALLREWNLPPIYQEVTEYHHNPDDAPLFQFEASLCHVSDIIANTLQLGCSGESINVPELKEKAWANVQLTKEVSLENIKADIDVILEEMVQVFLDH